MKVLIIFLILSCTLIAANSTLKHAARFKEWKEKYLNKKDDKETEEKR